MRAAYAESINPDEPLAGLVIGERPEPSVPAGWSKVAVKAASLNHHDLWTLRGVGHHRRAAADDPRAATRPASTPRPATRWSCTR